MFRELRRRIDGTTLVACAALVFAMAGSALATGGGASAAKHKGHTRVLITSSKQISAKVRKQLRGRQGPAGANGRDGAPGAKGEPGPPGPTSGSAGGDLTGSYPNPQIASGAVGPSKLGTIPAARVTPAAVQSISNNTPTALEFGPDTVVYDTAGMFSAGNPSRLTAPIAGIYTINADVDWELNGSGVRGVTAFQNGSTAIARSEIGAAGTATETTQSLSTDVRLEAGEYVELHAYQNSGGSLEVLPAGGVTAFEMRWVAP